MSRRRGVTLNRLYTSVNYWPVGPIPIRLLRVWPVLRRARQVEAALAAQSPCVPGRGRLDAVPGSQSSRFPG
jgi:hypothetical protein